MQRLSQHKNATAAKDYYKTHLGQVLGDYYQDGKEIAPEMIGGVHGKVAERLGMEGTMTQQQFFDLIDNKHPITGERLTKRHNADGNRRVGVDLYLDLGGKSLSAAFAKTRSPLITKLFDETVSEFMEKEVEPRMHVRVRQDGQNTTRRTGEALWTTFTHLTTRPTRVKDEATGKWVEAGTADPHIHQHVYIMPATYDAKYRNRDGSKGAVLAAEMGAEIWSNAAYLQQNFNARLAKKFRDAGFNIQRTEHGMDLVGWTPEMDQAFSRRKHEIEDWAAAKGITNVADKSKGGKATRSSKDQLQLTMDEQFEEWADRLPAETWDSLLDSIYSDDGGKNWPDSGEEQAAEFGLTHSLERDNSATLEEVMYASLDRGMGNVDVDQLQQQLLNRDNVITAEIDGRKMITTTEALKLEQEVMDWALRGQGTRAMLGGEKREAKQKTQSGITFNNNQQEGIEQLLSSTSKLSTLKGSPGVGKTTVLQRLVQEVKANGGNYFALGATSNARDELIQSGLEAQTVAKLLDDPKMQAKLNADTLVIVDETTMLGLENLRDLTRVIDQHGSRLLLVGDSRQMQSVPRNGKMFEQLHQRIQPSVELTEIVRQRDHDYRQAAMLSSSSDIKQIQKGFDQLESLGFIHELKDSKDRSEQAAKTYLEITGEKTGNRGQLLKWTDEQKQDSSMYRSGMTVMMGKGKSARKLEVVGREAGQVMVAEPGSNDAAPLNLNDATRIKVYEATYRDALIVVGSHKEGERIANKIRDSKKLAGELGMEHRFDRLESVGMSDQQKKLADQYQPGMVLEFMQKDIAKPADAEGSTRSITYGDRFTIEGKNREGELQMTSEHGERLLVPLDHSKRFDVYQTRSTRLAVGERLRMTKNGRFLTDPGKKQGVRFSNNDVFTIRGFDPDGNPIVGDRGHRIDKQFAHHRSGYYSTAMSSQGSTASHTIYVLSKEAGRSRSSESYLVAMSRGKHAATLICDSIEETRSKAITRTSQRPSATEISSVKAKLTSEQAKHQIQRVERQGGLLRRFGAYARLATSAALDALHRGRLQLSEFNPSPSRDPSSEPVT